MHCFLDSLVLALFKQGALDLPFSLCLCLALCKNQSHCQQLSVTGLLSWLLPSLGGTASVHEVIAVSAPLAPPAPVLNLRPRNLLQGSLTVEHAGGWGY